MTALSDIHRFTVFRPTSSRSVRFLEFISSKVFFYFFQGIRISNKIPRCNVIVLPPKKKILNLCMLKYERNTVQFSNRYQAHVKIFREDKVADDVFCLFFLAFSSPSFPLACLVRIVLVLCSRTRTRTMMEKAIKKRRLKKQT